jgi:hypothetical protein
VAGKTEETTLPAPTRLGEEKTPTEEEGARMFREAAPGVAGGDEAEGPPTLPKGARAPDEAAEATGPGEGGALPADDSEQAPTLPTSKAAEYAGLDPSLPPTLPPGLVKTAETEPSEVPGGAAGTAPPSEAEVESKTPETTPPSVPRPPAAPEAAPPVAAPEEALAPAAPPPAEDKPPPADAAPTAPGPTALEPADRGGTPLSSGTLAELYFQQGLLKRALEVYHQVLQEEPDNEKARARLAEIQAEMEASSPRVTTGAMTTEGTDTEARRRTLERTIERLEALLAIVRRRRR